MTFKINAIKCILSKDKTSLKDCYHKDKEDEELGEGAVQFYI